MSRERGVEDSLPSTCGPGPSSSPALSCCSGPRLPLVKCWQWLPPEVLLGLGPAAACRPGAHSFHPVGAPSASHPLSLPQFAHLSTPVTSVPAGQVAMLSKETLLKGPGFRQRALYGRGACDLANEAGTRPQQKGAQEMLSAVMKMMIKCRSFSGQSDSQGGRASPGDRVEFLELYSSPAVNEWPRLLRLEEGAGIRYLLALIPPCPALQAGRGPA